MGWIAGCWGLGVEGAVYTRYRGLIVIVMKIINEKAIRSEVATRKGGVHLEYNREKRETASE